MEKRTVGKLERELEKAIIDVICRMGLKKLPLLPDHNSIRQMAKAAVAVYEAVVRQDSGPEE